MSPDDPRHGTNAGYIAHIFAAVTPCDPCRAASAAYQRERDKRLYLSRVGSLRIPAVGYHRRMQALVALGWSMRTLDEELGNQPGTLSCWLRDAAPWVHHANAERIHDVYERLSMKVPPADYRRSRARGLAKRRGWVPPLAWDDIDRDREPRVDLDAPRPIGRPEVITAKVEDFEFLRACGESEETAAARLGIRSLDSFKDQRRRLRQSQEVA